MHAPAVVAGPDGEIYRLFAHQPGDDRVQIRHAVEVQVGEMQQAVTVELRRQIRMRQGQLDQAEIEGAAHPGLEQARGLEQNPERDEQPLELAPAAVARPEGRVLLVARLHRGPLGPPDGAVGHGRILGARGRYPHCPRCRSRWSARTTASIASPTGTARIPTQGSCRPLVTTSMFSPCLVTPLRGVGIELVGFTANRTTMSWPVEMPPRMPPALLERNVTWPSCMRISSALASPERRAASKPAPISTPFTALMLIMAAARSASSLP